MAGPATGAARDADWATRTARLILNLVFADSGTDTRLGCGRRVAAAMGLPAAGEAKTSRTITEARVTNRDRGGWRMAARSLPRHPSAGDRARVATAPGIYVSRAPAVKDFGRSNVRAPGTTLRRDEPEPACL
jgi:hypothetical protein